MGRRSIPLAIAGTSVSATSRLASSEQIRAKLLDELADLTAFRLHAEKVLVELYGNAQAYRL